MEWFLCSKSHWIMLMKNRTLFPCQKVKVDLKKKELYSMKGLFNSCHPMPGKHLNCSNSKSLLEYKACSMLSNYISWEIWAVLLILLFSSLQRSFLSPNPASAHKCQETVCAVEVWLFAQPSLCFMENFQDFLPFYVVRKIWLFCFI